MNWDRLRLQAFACLFFLLCLFDRNVGQEEESKTVLVTGGAGFIGFFVAKKLKEEHDTNVVVLDNFNDYYDVNLKKSRAAVMKSKGVEVHKGDLCDERLLRFLFEKKNFDAVVHMAAQAGVTYSVENPLSYVTNNIECLVNLLDVLASYPHVHLVFSSSSSVYGNNPHVPFSTEYPLVAPSNMYAALKMAGEEMVAAYCEKYGLSVVGVRPFTVYGPWGRPDMAVYGMGKKMFHDEEIEVRCYNGTVVASRDFTYVEDLVDGVISALNYKPEKCGEVYNLGRGRPISVSLLVELLETNLGKKAKIKYVPLPNYELPITHADISLTEKVLGYKPKFHVEEGIKNFVEWFKDYYVDEKYPPQEPDSSIADSLDKSNLDYLNDQYHERIAKLRLKYEDYANQNNMPVAKFFKNKQFIEYKGRDSPGRTVRNMKGKSVKELEKMCRIIDECVGFNSKGDLKVFLSPEAKWSRSSSNLYVADINVCEAGVHNCFGNSTCTSIGPGQFKCGCAEGWGLIDDHTCIKLYVSGKQTEAARDHVVADEIDGVSWDELKKGKEFVKFPKKGAAGGDIAYYPSANGDYDKLKKACDETYHCMGFTTKGELKGMIRPFKEWKSSSGDLYVIDVDYCSMNPIGCKRGQSCKKSNPAEYSCRV